MPKNLSSYLLINFISIILDDWECENMHGTCVKLYKTEKTWEDALSFCNAIGADLPSVPSSTYQDWVSG